MEVIGDGPNDRLNFLSLRHFERKNSIGLDERHRLELSSDIFRSRIIIRENHANPDRKLRFPRTNRIFFFKRPNLLETTWLKLDPFGQRGELDSEFSRN